MKFVTPLNAVTRKQLQAIYHDDDSFKRRLRAHAVLQSDRHYTIDQLTDIFDADRYTISIWLPHWEKHAFDGLFDAARPGRPRKTSARGCDDSPRSIVEPLGSSAAEQNCRSSTAKKRFLSAPRRFAVVSRKPDIASNRLSSARLKLLPLNNTSDARNIWQNVNADKIGATTNGMAASESSALA